MHRFKSVFLSCPLKSEDIYNLTTVILHTKCRCSRQKEIKDVVDEKTESLAEQKRLCFCAQGAAPLDQPHIMNLRIE